MNNKEKQEFIKDKIINALFELLKHKELEAMTADEIAKEASVSKRTLYKYYSSKKEMYLALVLKAFMELAEIVKCRMLQVTEEDPWYMIECIGREYMKYCIDNRIKAKIMLEFDEMKYIDKYMGWVESIREFSNSIDLVPLIASYYEYHNIEPEMSIPSMALYLWAEAQGISALLLSKNEWIEGYYGVDTNQLIDDHIQLSKKVLRVVK